MTHVPLYIYPGIISLLSLAIAGLLLVRWTKNKDTSLLHWMTGFFLYFLSYLLNTLFVADMLPASGMLYVVLHFIRQNLVSLFFVFVYLGVIVLVTKNKKWTLWFPLIFFLLQAIVTGYYDFVGLRILLAENLHIYLFDIPYNILISVLFMRYWIISKRRFSIVQSLAWFGYLIIVSIGFGVEFSVLFFTISLVPMVIMFVGFIEYYKRPLEEHLLEITPKIEIHTRKEGLKYKLKPGQVHLVEEQKPHKSFDMFVDYVLHQTYGLCFTRTNPKAIRQCFGLLQTPVVWLTRLETDIQALNPLELEQLTFAVSQFIEQTAGKKSIVILDGVEYLATNNPFTKVLHAVSMIKDKVSGTNSIVVLPIDKEAFAEKDYSMLSEELS